MRWTLPNILTVLRLLAAPGVALVFVLLPRPFADWAALILFVGAALTDWLDGWLARRWHLVSRFGAMLDPIADKAMVVITMAVVLMLWGLTAWILVPAVVIFLREVFVSGLREYLGSAAKTLAVTGLAKWKTSVQMVAIAALLASGLFQHYFGMWSWGMSAEMIGAILDGAMPDELGLRTVWRGYLVSSWGGIALLWLAAALTLSSGIDYLRKAMPHLAEGTDA